MTKALSAQKKREIRAMADAAAEAMAAVVKASQVRQAKRLGAKASAGPTLIFSSETCFDTSPRSNSIFFFAETLTSSSRHMSGMTARVPLALIMLTVLVARAVCSRFDGRPVLLPSKYAIA